MLVNKIRLLLEQSRRLFVYLFVLILIICKCRIETWGVKIEKKTKIEIEYKTF